ncbi:MAG TPA: hypothetical protein VFH48_22290 [Chloroflexota bacterium]|nr:hypothetical protein [Chloroflexota bacterium]
MIGTSIQRNRRAAMLVLVLLLLGAGFVEREPQTAHAAGPQASAPASWPPFVIGASYQGPASRSWRGDYWAWWAVDLFDPQLVDADFARAEAAGLNTLRVFVQLELVRQIRDGNWTELDTILDLADRHNLRLIVTLGDYDEPRVSQLARIDSAISARYAGRRTILAYDLRNEPTFWMLQSAAYPSDQRPPLLSRSLLERYGEQAANHYIEAFRASEEGKRGPLAIPERFSEEDAYVYHNNWLLSYKLSVEANDWAKRTGRSGLEYFGSPDAARWRPFLDALDATYRAWLEPRISAIREADPAATITIGHHDPLIAALPANRQLDVISFHHYVPTGPAGLADQRQQLLALRGLYPDKPVMLGEFGHRATEIGDEAAAIEEAATWLQLLADGFAGGLKWQLNDTRDGTDTMGLFRMDGWPRPIARAAALISQLVTASSAGPAGTLTVSTDDAGGTCYRFTRGDLLALGGRCGTSGSPAELLEASSLVLRIANR